MGKLIFGALLAALCVAMVALVIDNACHSSLSASATIRSIIVGGASSAASVNFIKAGIAEIRERRASNDTAKS